MAMKQSVELRLNKAFTKEAREASLAARRAKKAPGADYANAKSGGEGGSTPGQRDGQRRAAHDKGPLGDHALKRRQQMDDLLAPEWPAHPKTKPMTTSQAIRKYGFEDPRTLAIAQREDAAKKKANDPETKMINKVKDEIRAGLMKEHGPKIANQEAATRAAYKALNHGKKNGAKDVSQLEAKARAENRKLKIMKTQVEQMVAKHPRLQRLKDDITAYKKVRGW